MKQNTLFALMVFFMISCTSERSAEEQDPDEQTPEVLNDGMLDISSYGKRYGTDIIQELFEEAVENDKDLKRATSTLERVKELKSDSLEAYQTYTKNNQNYWNALMSYSNQLSDSTMQKELLKFMETLKTEHSKRTSALDKVAAGIDSTEQALGDLEILMKIFVTERMMNNYQRNELPNIHTLESVKQAMDSSINVIEPFAKIQK